MGRRDEEPCCDGNSLKIPCFGGIPPFRLHYMLLLILAFICLFKFMGPEVWNNNSSSTTANGQYSPLSIRM